MITDCVLSAEGSFAGEMQRLLHTASQTPWGPERELDAKVHFLHQALVGIRSRLGSEAEQPEDAELVHQVEHDLRNKLMIFQYHEQKRRATTPLKVT